MQEILIAANEQFPLGQYGLEPQALATLRSRNLSNIPDQGTDVYVLNAGKIGPGKIQKI